MGGRLNYSLWLRESWRFKSSGTHCEFLEIGKYVYCETTFWPKPSAVVGFTVSETLQFGVTFLF
jgi:hypothetical protein